MRYTKQQFDQDFPTEKACLDTIFQERYGHLKDCPKCGVIDTKWYLVKGRKCYACKDCGYQISPLAGTIFHKSSTSLLKWFYAIYLFSVSKNGVAAMEIARHVGVTEKTAFRMAQKIRTLMNQEGPPLGGDGRIVEADETFMGGRRRRWQRMTKKPVLGAVERGGRVRAWVTNTASTRRAQDFLLKNVYLRNPLHTDESNIYAWTNGLYHHEVINHSHKEYARGTVNTNTIEGFWSQLKRSISGTHHHVSDTYLQLYVDEFVWRYSHRGETLYPLLLALAAKPVESTR